MRGEHEREGTGFDARSTNDHERRLLMRVAAGDRQAFQALYLGYHRRLARFLTRLTRRYDVAEEVINDTLWVVWCKAGTFRGESLVSTWIMGIAYRRALKAIRQLDGLNRAMSQAAGEEEAASPPAHELEELRECLDAALRQLPLEQRMVVELTYFLGHSCEEIAGIMDCPVNTVKTRMFHARKKLRTLVSDWVGAQPGGPA